MPDLFSSILSNVSSGLPASGASAGAGGIPNLFQPNLMPFSFSGVDPGFSSPLLSQVGPLLQQYLSGMPTSVNNFTRSSTMPVLNDIMQGLGSRRMLNSSVASDALSKGITGMGNQAAQLQFQTPAMLGQLATNIGGGSLSANPLAPYELMNQFLLGY